MEKELKVSVCCLAYAFCLGVWFSILMFDVAASKNWAVDAAAVLVCVFLIGWSIGRARNG